MTLNTRQIQSIIILRGLGYSQREVADKVKTSRKTVENYLRKFKSEVYENGLEDTFWSYFASDISMLRVIVCNKYSEKEDGAKR